MAASVRADDAALGDSVVGRRRVRRTRREHHGPGRDQQPDRPENPAHHPPPSGHLRIAAFTQFLESMTPLSATAWWADVACAVPAANTVAPAAISKATAPSTRRTIRRHPIMCM
jgi:hypothetical protein